MRELPAEVRQDSSSLAGATILRHVLDRVEIGGAVLDVDVLDRALLRRHPGLVIHKLYLSIGERGTSRESVFGGEIHYHPIPYVKSRLEADAPDLVARLCGAFEAIAAHSPPALFVNHVPEHPSGHLLAAAARRRRIPVVSVFHGGSKPARGYDAAHERGMEEIVRNLRASAGLSDRMAAVSASASRLLPMTPVTNVSTGADDRYLDEALPAARDLHALFGFPRTLPIVLLPARMVPEKGHELLLAASHLLFQREIDHRVVFVGSADRERRVAIEEWLVTNGIRSTVGILYDVTQEEMPAIYRGAEIVCLPGFHMEGCPRVLIEAGLLERPVVATDSGGTRESFLPGTSGLLVPVADATSLANALAVLMLDPERRLSMGRAGRVFARRTFAPDVLASRHEALYATVIAASTTAAV